MRVNQPARAVGSKPWWLPVLLLTALAVIFTGVTRVALAVSPPAAPKAAAVTDSATALTVSWPAVKDAAGYRVQYSTSAAFSSPKYLPATTGKGALTATKTTIGGLKTDQVFYFRVAATDATNSKLTSTWGAVTKAAARYPYAAPGDVAAIAVTKGSLKLSWKAVGGAPGYKVRVYTARTGARWIATPTNALALTGLRPDTTYYISAAVEKPATGTAKAETLSKSSPETVVTTSTYATPSPDGLEVTSQKPTSIALAWTAVAGLPKDAKYRVDYALDAAQTVSRVSRGPFATPAATLTGLTTNTTYFGVVYAVDKDNKRISGSSDFVVLKTLVPRGTIKGKATGVNGGDLTASAYSMGGELAQQVRVSSAGNYELSLRPGDYRIFISYVGTGNYTSLWARKDSTGGRLSAEATPVRVATGRETTAPAVRVASGGKVSGVVKDASGRPVRDVDVTAITYFNDAREVEAIGRSGPDGKYSIQGLPNGQHWLRYIYAGDGFANRSVAVTITKGKITKVRVSTSTRASTATVEDPFTAVNVRLDNANFRKRYGAYIIGSRTVGSTVRAHATPWLAGSYPTTRAAMSYQWKRNGVAIKGATGTRYKLTQADKGQKVSVTVTARRYGYNTGSATSKAASIR